MASDHSDRSIEMQFQGHVLPTWLLIIIIVNKTQGLYQYPLFILFFHTALPGIKWGQVCEEDSNR